MDQTEFKKTLVELYAEYVEAVDKRSAEIQKSKTDGRPGITPDFQGFVFWLEKGKVDNIEEEK